MDLKIYTENIETVALEQIHRLMEMPAFKDCKVRIMPDVHAGAGCVIGFTADLGDKVIPNIVGVDIGCGMLTANLGQIDLNLEQLDNCIKQNVPAGMNVHKEVQPFDFTSLRCYKELKNINHIECSLGTLGGGNHFIEVDTDSEGNKYLIIHTGSRNLGKQVAEIYQRKAIDYISGADKMDEAIATLIKTYKADGRQSEINDAIIALKANYKDKVPDMPKELCYLEGQNREDYLHDMKICQEFAVANRKMIVETICKKMGIHYVDIFETIHNYISFEDNIVRKGAISARKGERVLIPMNMRDGCIIGIGKGNEDWNCSAPHGAGRLMSRAEARRELQLEDFQETMKGIYSTTVNMSTIDEAPFAYKPAQEIIDNVKDTIDIIDILKPIYNFKASE